MASLYKTQKNEDYSKDGYTDGIGFGLQTSTNTRVNLVTHTHTHTALVFINFIHGYMFRL